MSDIIENYLRYHGPCLTSDVSAYLTNDQKLTPAAARKRVSRAKGQVRRLSYINFPRKARFIYLQEQFGSPTFWDRLVEKLLQAKSAYGLAIAAIQQRGGLIPLRHFEIACGAPFRQKRHLSPTIISDRLIQAKLLQRTDVPGLGECITLIQSAGYYDRIAGEVRARLIAENFLLLAIGSWLRKLGLVSYDKVKIRGGDSPKVGPFVWDLSAPSYLGCMVKSDKHGHVKPGFIACDVYLGDGPVDKNGIQPFINKCVKLRKLHNIGSCMQLFVADEYAQDAFQDLKNNGIIPATPSNLFGKEVGEGLTALFQVLRDAARKAIDPESFDLLFRTLGRIEGAATQLRGTLFEYLVADVLRKKSAPEVRMNRIFKSPDAKKAEADIIAIKDHSWVIFIECKGYNPHAEVPDAHVDRWLNHNVPIFYKCILAHPDWKKLKKKFHFWTTGSLSATALDKIEHAKKEINPERYTIDLRLGPQILKICESTKETGLVDAFRKHFTKLHP